MKKYGLFGFLGLAGLSAVLALPARAEDSPQVFISEINWAGSERSTADEWLELVNLGSSSVDLSHYVLTGVATGGQAIEIAEGTTLSPGKTLVISNYAANDPKSTLLISPDLVTTAISLPNSALDILLATPAGLVIDSYADTATPDFGSSNPTISIERNLMAMTWQASTQNLSLASSTQLGTPGSVSLPSPQVESAPAPIVSEPPVVEVEMTAPPVLPMAGEEIEMPVQVEPEPAVIDIFEPAPLPSPCTQVVLESEPPTAISWPTQTVETLPEPAQISSTPSASSTPSEAVNTPSVQNIAPGELVLNELVSDPMDGVEWLEILNPSLVAIDLTDSTLLDAGNHVTELPAQTLNAGDLVVIENPNGNLNNSGDTITLLDATGDQLDTITYGTTENPAPQDGESLARTSDGDWLITDATRNTPNVFPTAVAESQTSSTSSTSVSTNQYDTPTNEPDPDLIDFGTVTQPVAENNDSEPAGAEPIQRIVAIAQSVNPAGPSPAPTRKAKSKTSTPLTVVTGTLIALPNTFGKQTIFLDGHEIYFNAADWPELQLGDVLQVSGTAATSEGVERLKVKAATDIVITGHVDQTAAPIDGAELAQMSHGTLVSVAGQIIGKAGDKLMLKTDDGTEISVVAYKKTGVTWSSITSGNAIMTGIVRITADGPRVYVRSQDDVHVTPDADSVVNPTKLASKQMSTSPLVGGGLLTGSLGALGTWYAKSRNLLSWLSV